MERSRNCQPGASRESRSRMSESLNCERRSFSSSEQQLRESLEQQLRESLEQKLSEQRESLEQQLREQREKDSIDWNQKFENWKKEFTKLLEKDAFIWGKTEVLVVTAELLHHGIRCHFPEKRHIKPSIPSTMYASMRFTEKIKKLAKEMSLSVDDLVYMADVIITERNAVAHLGDCQQQINILIGKEDPPTCSQGCSYSAKISSRRIEGCLELLERYESLKNECSYHWTILGKHKELCRVFNVELI